MKVSRAGLDLIKSFEGHRESAARLSDGRWIVGYGHVRTAREGVTVSEKDAEDMLKFDLKPVEEAINALVFSPLRQSQFDALVSLVFNISPGQFKESDVLRALNAGDEIAAANGFDAWRRARINGRLIVVDALVRRRSAEKAMFLEHPEGRPTAPTPVVTPEFDPQMQAQSAKEPTTVRASEPPPPPPPAAEPQVADAIQRLANEQGARKPGNGHGQMRSGHAAPASATAYKNEPPPPPKDLPTTPETESQLVAARLARILEKTEQDAATAQAAPGSASKTSTPKRTLVAEPPEFDPAKAVPPSAPQGKVLIDDTEIYDPGKDPAALFAEGLKRHRGRVIRTAPAAKPVKGSLLRVIPWLAFLGVSLVALVVSLYLALRPDVSGAQEVTVGPLAGAIVFALLAIMSIYFIATRSGGRT